jgi:serine/threonine protein kinase
MNHCLNPLCREPQNPNDADVCQSCGQSLLLDRRYLAIKPLGQGGFGRTFLAVDVESPLKPRCVIKQFFPQQGVGNQDKALVLFEQEADRLADLGDNANVPQLFEAFAENGQEYLIQEFIDGQNLAQELAEHDTYSEAQIIELLESLLATLDSIHQKQVIHRDVKPENIIRRRDGKLFLVDLGAAKTATGTALGRTGTVIGSAEYVAPEQSRGKAVFASDLYSLGVTCLHLLTGLSPFDLYDMANGGWAWRDVVQQPVSKELGAILDRLIAPPTNQRYGSAREALNALQALRNPNAWAHPAKSGDWNKTTHWTSNPTRMLAANVVGFTLLFLIAAAFSAAPWRQKTAEVPAPAPIPAPAPSPLPIVPSPAPIPRFNNTIVPDATYRVPAFEHIELVTKNNVTTVTMVNSWNHQEINFPPEGKQITLLNLQTGKLSRKRLKPPLSSPGVQPGELITTFPNSGNVMIAGGTEFTTSNGQPGSLRVNELWSVNDSTETISAQQLEIKDDYFPGNCSALNANGSQVISLASSNANGVISNRILVWDSATGKLNPNFSDFKIPTDESSDLGGYDACSLRWSSITNAPLLATNRPIANGSIVSVWNLATGRPQITIPVDIENRVKALSLSHDGNLLAGSTATGINVWDARTGALLRIIPYPYANGLGPPVSFWIKFTSDNKTLVHGLQQLDPTNQTMPNWSITLWNVDRLVKP